MSLTKNQKDAIVKPLKAHLAATKKTDKKLRTQLEENLGTSLFNIPDEALFIIEDLSHVIFQSIDTKYTSLLVVYNPDDTSSIGNTSIQVIPNLPDYSKKPIKVSFYANPNIKNGKIVVIK